jgi:hypothetical protein
MYVGCRHGQLYAGRLPERINVLYHCSLRRLLLLIGLAVRFDGKSCQNSTSLRCRCFYARTHAHIQARIRTLLFLQVVVDDLFPLAATPTIHSARDAVNFIGGTCSPYHPAATQVCGLCVGWGTRYTALKGYLCRHARLRKVNGRRGRVRIRVMVFDLKKLTRLLS